MIPVDVNKDGNSDVVTSHSTGRVAVLLGQGDGTLTLTWEMTLAGDTGPTRAGDLNGDGNPDLVVTNLPDHIVVLLGNGAGSVRTGEKIRLEPYPSRWGVVVETPAL
jgi:hypothetical protein